MNVSSFGKPPKRRFWLKVTLFLSAIIVALLVIAFYALGPRIVSRPLDKLQADFMAFEQSLQAYENLNGFLPTTEQGLDALVSPPTIGPKPAHWYQMLKRLPKDPFGNDYIYIRPGRHNSHGFDVYSKGKDCVADTADDVGNWYFK